MPTDRVSQSSGLGLLVLAKFAPIQSTVGLAQTRARLLLPFSAAQAMGPSATALSLVAWLPWLLEEDTTM